MAKKKPLEIIVRDNEELEGKFFAFDFYSNATKDEAGSIAHGIAIYKVINGGIGNKKLILSLLPT